MDYASFYPFWEQLTEEEKDYTKHACRSEKYAKGTLVHRSEEVCKGLMTVLKGELRAYLLSDEGREVTLFHVYENSVCVLSASCLMEAVDFDVLIEAAEDTEVVVFPSVQLKSLLQKNPSVELYLYKAAADKFSEVMWTMQQILFRKTDQRIAAYLWDASIRKNSNTLSVIHEEIAKDIGSAREVVTKILKYFAEDGVVQLKRGKIILLDKDKLRNYL